MWSTSKQLKRSQCHELMINEMQIKVTGRNYSISLAVDKVLPLPLLNDYDHVKEWKPCTLQMRMLIIALSEGSL